MFCRFILPYKSGIDSFWEGAIPYYYQKYHPDMDSLTGESIDVLARYIKDTVKSSFMEDGVFAGKYSFLFPTSYYNIFRARIGTCNEAYGLIITALRSVGIPATTAFIPYWGNSNASHTLLEIPTIKPAKRYNNKQTPYVDKKSETVGEMFWFKHHFENLDKTAPDVDIRFTRTIPKIYQDNYEFKPNEFSNLSVPSLFYKNYTDITDKYVECADVNLEIKDKINGESFIYLCCYVPESTSWTPVAYAKLSSNGEVLFQKMGINIVYLPAYYINNRIVPAASPFLLTDSGSVEYFDADIKKPTEAKLTAKVPYRGHILYYADDMVGHTFSLANHSDLSDAVTVHEITKIPYYVQKVNVDFSQPSRYVVYNFGDSPYGFLAQMEVWGIDDAGNEVQLKGTTIGNPGQYSNERDKIIDGDRVSFFFADTQYGELDYVGIDLGKPYRITQINYLPRNDDNAVVPGVKYELFYWHNGWQSLGIRVGNEDGAVMYNNIPSNSLLRLHNTEEGIENRIFIVHDQKPIFY